MSVAVTSIYASLLAILLLILSAFVSKNRLRAHVSVGAGGDTALENAMRAQGNFVEYVPLAVLLLLLAELQGGQTWLLHAFGLTLLAGRLLHAWGITRENNVNNARKIGVSMTWLMLLAVAVYNLWKF